MAKVVKKWTKIPIVGLYFYQFYFKRKQDYGNKAVVGVLSCNVIVLNCTIIMYDKTKSKIKIVHDIAGKLPVPSVTSYIIYDSGYRCGNIMDAYI